MSRQFEHTSVFVIREKASGKLIKFGSKCGWMSSGAAKGAFALHMWHHFGLSRIDSTKGLFDNQDEFVLEEIK